MLKDEDILYCDNHILAVNKPAGIVCQPSKEHPIGLEDHAKAWLKEKFNKPGNVFCHVVHRLDKPVSGVVIMARTDKALSRLMASVRERKVGKNYLAILENSPPQPQGTLEDWLLHDNFKSKVVKPNTPNSQLSKLDYKIVKEVDKQVLVDIELTTGRYHQIRVQFGSRKAAILGDKTYGARTILPNNTIALHHYKFILEHPTKKETIIVTAPVLTLNYWSKFNINKEFNLI